MIHLTSGNTPLIVLISHLIILYRRSIRLKKGSVGAGPGTERKKSEQNESEEGKEPRRDRPDTQ